MVSLLYRVSLENKVEFRERKKFLFQLIVGNETNSLYEIAALPVVCVSIWDFEMVYFGQSVDSALPMCYHKHIEFRTEQGGLL